MTISEIKRNICIWINSLDLGATAIITPTSHEAPAGTYIAVRDLGVSHYGEPLKPKPTNTGTPNDTAFIYTADIIVTEVEGEGDILRNIRNLMQLPTFRNQMEAVGFTLWEVGDIMNNDVQDVDFWVKQKSFTFTVNFTDHVAYSAQRALAASVEVNGDTIEAAINTNNN